MKKQLLALAIVIAFATSLQAQVKTPINKIVDQNLQPLYPVIQDLTKPQLLDLQEAVLKLHETYKVIVMKFEEKLLATKLTKAQYNSLLSLLTKLYNGESVIMESKKANVVYGFFQDISESYAAIKDAAKQHNKSVSSVAPKLPVISNKGEHFLAYVIGRLAIHQQQ